MKLKHTLYFLIIGISVSVLSCKKEDKIYLGKPLIEFANSAYNIQIPATQTSVKTMNLKLQLNSKPFDKDKVIYIELIGENTAQQDVDYSVSEYKTILYKDSTFAYLSINILCKNISESKNVKLNLKISDKSDISPSTNQNTCSIEITKTRFINLFVGKYICNEPVNQDSYQTIFSIENEAQNKIKNLNFWNFPGERQSVIYRIYKDSTQKVEIPVQNWIDKAGNEYKISGQGTYSLDGSMIVKYTILRSDTLYEEGTHTFTPIY